MRDLIGGFNQTEEINEPMFPSVYWAKDRWIVAFSTGRSGSIDFSVKDKLYLSVRCVRTLSN